MLGGNVGRRVGEADRAEDRRHVDDRAATPLHHRGELAAQAVEHPAQVDGDHSLPSLDGVFSGGHLVAADARVVDRDV
jgi:hypothetical protein